MLSASACPMPLCGDGSANPTTQYAPLAPVVDAYVPLTAPLCDCVNQVTDPKLFIQLPLTLIGSSPVSDLVHRARLKRPWSVVRALDQTRPIDLVEDDHADRREVISLRRFRDVVDVRGVDVLHQHGADEHEVVESEGIELRQRF